MPKTKNPLSTVKEKLGLSKKTLPFDSSRNFSEKTDNQIEGTKEDFYTQNLVDIVEIQDGLIITKTGEIVKILEILPLNYDELPASTKDDMADLFGNGIKQCPKVGHIKIMRSSADITPFVQYVRECMKYRTDENIRLRVEDYIQNTLRLQEADTKKNRFFYIFSYEGDAKGRKSDRWNAIFEQMWQTTISVKNALEASGNIVIDYKNDHILDLVNILFRHYNPLTARTETVSDRIEHVRSAKDYLEQVERYDVCPPFQDYIAPRGLHFGKWDFCVQDGLFHTYLSLREGSYPTECYAGQLTSFLIRDLNDCDLDIFIREKGREITSYFLDRTNVISKGVARSFQGDDSKVEALSSTAQNAKYIKDCINKNDEDIYDVFIILTIRASSQKELQSITDAYIKKMKSASIYFERCFLNTQEYWRMVQPITYINNGIFKDNSRNMTNSSLAALYPFTSYEMFDPEGGCLGRTVRNATLFSLNNFDSKKYPNPHIFLAGTSGAGKTYTELMLTSRMFMHGARVIYILPLKGHEYKNCVLSLGGTFISLRPGSEACVNIMEIRPEAMADLSDLDDEEVKEELARRPSMLAKKITSLVTWFRLLLGDDNLPPDEEGELNALLTEVYESFGITEDNESVWENASAGQLKRMPILEDLYRAMVNNDILGKKASVLKPWVSGNCRNMNGQTNVDMNNMCIAFDIDEDNIGEALLPAFMYIAFDAGYDICKRNDEEKCVIALDEVWKLIQIEACAKQVFKMIKILRAYKSAAITATQDIEDCLNNKYGRAILTNSAIKIFLKVNEEELRILEESVQLSSENKSSLLKAPQGRGFITFNSERLYVDFISSEYETELYTTDAKLRKELRKKRLNGTGAFGGSTFVNK